MKKTLTAADKMLMFVRAERRAHIKKYEITPEFRDRRVQLAMQRNRLGKPVDPDFFASVSPYYDEGEERIRVKREDALNRSTRLESLVRLVQPEPWFKRLRTWWREHRSTAVLTIAAPVALFLIVSYMGR